MSIHIERIGQGERIIFIHGSGLSGRLWYKQFLSLKDFFEIILVDLPGHGKSSGYGCESVEEYRDFIKTVISDNSFAPCYVAGHSLGGAITISLALTCSELLKGIILIGTGAKLRVLPKILEGIKKDKEEIVRYIIDLSFSQKTEKELKEHFLKEMMNCDSEIIFRDFNACDKFNVMDKVKLIDINTLIICGSDDLLTPPKYSYYLHNEIKNSDLVIIPDAGHMVMVEKPEDTNQAIKNFLLVEKNK